MGTLVDFSTLRRNNQQLRYKISGNSGVRFQVKGSGFAGVRLMCGLNTDTQLWVILGFQGNKSIVMKDGQLAYSVATPYIITPAEFRTFWLKLHNDTISVGRDSELKPFMVYKTKTSDMKYITFGHYNANTFPIHWRIEMPPLLENIKIKGVSNGNLQWNSTENNQLPGDSLIGGFEQDMLYIIRAEHNGSLTPGKYVPSQGLAYIAWGGESHPKDDFEVLCGYDGIWVPCSNGAVPLGAVIGGHSEVSVHETLYVGRGMVNNHLVPGKVQPSHKVCYIPYEGREIAVKHYEVLVSPKENMQSENILSTHNPSSPDSSEEE